MKLRITDYMPENQIWTLSFAKALEELKSHDGGTLIVPAGEYHTGPIELYSNITLVLEEKAILLFLDDIEAFPLVECQYEGRLELRPKACISARNAQKFAIIGQGTVDGGGAKWWEGHRAGILPHGRPYLFHVQDCENVILRGITLCNSPTWTVHPLRCKDVCIESVTVINPNDSPNTDGINPESCKNVIIKNCAIDVGDDCITLKAGIAQTVPQVVCENIIISHCKLLHGHGGIVIGSEMSGGVRNIQVTDCAFINTDRGLRIKTHRGRGGLVENITLTNLTMQNVICPFVINMYYGCKIKEENRELWDKKPYAISDDTPCIRNITIRNVKVENAQASAAFFYGLPEMPISNVSMQDCEIYMSTTQQKVAPAMMYQPPEMAAQGLFMRNISAVTMKNIIVHNIMGQVYDIDENDSLFI